MAKARQTNPKMQKYPAGTLPLEESVETNGEAAIVPNDPQVKWVEVRIPYVEELPPGYVQKHAEVQFDPITAETWKKVTTALIILAEANPVHIPTTRQHSATHTLRWVGAELVKAIVSDDSQ